MPRKNIYNKLTDSKIVQLQVDNTQLKRPTAPKHLSKEEKEIWKNTVLSKPIPYFVSDSLQMLEQYCKATATLNAFYAMRNTFYEMNRTIDIISDKEILANADKIQLMIGRELKVVRELAKELGLFEKAPEAQADKPEAKKKPWE